MSVGGAIKKLIIGGLNYPLSSDNDANFTKGGTYLTEAQETTGGPFFLSDKISGSLKVLNLEQFLGRWSLIISMMPQKKVLIILFPVWLLWPMVFHSVLKVE